MNLKTTIVLALLVGAGTGAWFWLEFREPTETAVSPTLDFLSKDLIADKVTRVEVTRMVKPQAMPRLVAGVIGALGTGGPVQATSTLFPETPTTLFVLQKSGNEWSLPGNWPVRKPATEEWIAVLTSLRSRFAPIPIAKDAKPEDLKLFGLDENPLTIEVKVGDESVTLRFGEEPEGPNKFTRSTFVRLGKKDEVIRLGPGVYAALARKAEHFQQRRLFPIESVPKDRDSKEKVDQVVANAIEIETKNTKFAVVKKDKEWVLQDAHKKDGKEWKRIASEDRLDSSRRDALLRGIPDLWADRFVENKSLEECGLNEPEFIVSATKPNGRPIRLLIGKVAEPKDRAAKKDGLPAFPPTAGKDEYRYAKLAGNNQIFEIKTDKLGDITVKLDDLRDPRLADFSPRDVKRLEIRHGKEDLVLVKSKDGDKEKWRFEKPSKEDAESKMVEELLEKLASLQARDKEVHDEADAKAFGLDKPQGRIEITLEEIDKDAKKPDDGKKIDDKDVKKTTRKIAYQFGMKEKEDGKLYVRVDAWPRVNEVGGDFWKLVTRSDVAYRPREVWRIDHDTITRITIEADGMPYHLSRGDKGWKITGPLETDLDGKNAEALEMLADQLSHLRCERFETDKKKTAADFGLDKPAFTISVTAKDGKPHTLKIGKRIETPEGGRYAMVGDAVFVLSEKLTSQFRKDPFDLLDKNLLTLNPAALERIRFQGASSFTLAAKNDRWQVLDSPAPAFSVPDEIIKPALGAWSLLRADKIVAVGPKTDLARYGLDKPSATVTLTLKAADAQKAGEHVIELGKEVDGGGRYVRVDKKDLVAVFDSFAVEDLQPTYLEFLDTRILKFDGDAVTLIERKMKDADLELTRREENWLITKPGTRDADLLTLNDLLRKTSVLRAKRIAAFPAKDLDKFGLDKPAAIVTLLLETDGNTSKHVIKLGNRTNDKAKKETDERFAMIDDRPMVLVLSAELSRQLMAPALYYADRNLSPSFNVDRLELTRGSRKLAFSRPEKAWRLTEPVQANADDAMIEELVRSVQRLRADEIVADKGTDLKKYGLDPPFLQWRFKSGDVEQMNLLVGGTENDLPGARRYAKLGAKVFLLSSKLTAKLQAEYRSRAIIEGGFEVSKVTVIHQGKTVVLERKDKEWIDNAGKKLDGKTVGELFGALESLRALQFMDDSGKADLKQYGLAEPTWKLVVEGGKERRELWLGVYEGKSKRLYAMAPGTPGVFVLDEAISARIVQRLEAFVEAEKKK